MAEITCPFFSLTCVHKKLFLKQILSKSLGSSCGVVICMAFQILTILRRLFIFYRRKMNEVLLNVSLESFQAVNKLAHTQFPNPKTKCGVPSEVVRQTFLLWCVKESCPGFVPEAHENATCRTHTTGDTRKSRGRGRQGSG